MKLISDTSIVTSHVVVIRGLLPVAAKQFLAESNTENFVLLSTMGVSAVIIRKNDNLRYDVIFIKLHGRSCNLATSRYSR